jgi:uncharacterized membrane protein YphA (DoxX/SURF4 family)
VGRLRPKPAPEDLAELVLARSSARAVEPWLSTVFRLALGAVWIWAGLAKVFASDEAVRAVAAYRLLPHDLVRPIAWGLPFAELAVGVLLVLGIRTRAAAAVSLVVLALFVFAVASAWVRGLRIDCGCFGGGVASAEAGWRTYLLEIGRDLSFAALAAWLMIRPDSRLAMEGA